MAVGIASKPPATKQVRVSPGVYKTVSTAPAGKGSQAAGRGNGKGKQTQSSTPTDPQYRGLNDQQNQVINQRQQGDMQLGQFANSQLPNIQNSYSQPFDFAKYQAMNPTQGDWQGYIKNASDQYNNAYDQRMNPLNQHDDAQFQQDMSDKGIPMGSALYDHMYQQEKQAQSDARTQAYATGQTNAMNMASQGYNIGAQSQQNAYTMAQAQRNQPMNDYNTMMAGQSGMGMQNLAYSQNLGSQDNQAQNALMVNKNSPHGGGGGGGSAGLGGYNGTGMSFQDYLAATHAATQSDLAYQYANNPQYQQQPQPSYGAQVGGGILGAVASGLSQAAGKYIFSSI